MAKKRLQKWLAFCLAVSMLMGTTAMAVDGTEHIENPDGTVTQQVTTTTTETDENGKPTVVVTIEKKINQETGNVTEDGTVVELDEQRTETYENLGDEENPVPGDLEHYVDEGEETREWKTEEDETDPKVTVDLIPGKTTSASASETTTTGDTDKADGEWDYTETTTTDRTVTATTSEIKVQINDADTGLVGEKEIEIKGLDPVYDENDNAVYKANGGMADKNDAGEHVGKKDVFDRNYLSGKTLDYVNINGISIWVDKGSKKIVDIVTPEGAELPEHDLLKNVTVGASVTNWYPKSNTFAQTQFPEGTEYRGGVNMSNIENWYNTDDELILTVPEGADFRYVGTGEHSKFYNARVNVIYKKQEVLDENGNSVLEVVRDENGNPVIESIVKRDGTIITVNGVPATELPDEVSLKPIFDDYNGGRPTTFMLMDKNGNKVYAYCCDMETGAVSGSWYSVSNLEDSDYYGSQESEEHIRSIVMNGYWGTSDIPVKANEDGTKEYETGSLEKIKQNLKNAINNGEMQNEIVQMPKVDTDGNPVVDENGEPVMETKTMLELIDDMTEGEALLATQSAIWAYANGHVNALNGVDGTVVIDPDGYKWNQNPTSDSKDGEALNDFGSARVDFLYKWLIGLETEEESTVIINESNFVKDLSLTVGDKAEGFEQNLDGNDDNDVYNTDLNFKLAFVPSAENDDLLVQITYTDLDNKEQTIVKRLAGENSGEQTFEKIQPNEDGSYVISGLKLSENENFEFDLRLEGTQYLENGVYVYAPVGGRDVSQTFVGVAEGERNVDVSLGVTVSFDVDEDNYVRAKRVWRDEGSNQDSGDDDDDDDDTPKGDDDDDDTVIGDDDVPKGEFPGDDDDDIDNIPEEDIPMAELPDEDVPLEELPEEDIPLADVPKTGDASILWFALSALSGAGLMGLNLTGKKREDEE